MTFVFRVVNSHSRVGFSADSSDRRFSRAITLDGRPAYHLGAGCWSSQFVFTRVPAAESYSTVGDGDRIGGGQLTPSYLQARSADLPDGEYLAMELAESPRLVVAGGPGDYFREEMPRSFDLPSGYEIGTDYYRGRTFTFDDAGKKKLLAEFIVPLSDRASLDPAIVRSYERDARGAHDAAAALSLLEIHGPAWWGKGFTPEYYEHWCLAHFLLDGHHRTLAAARARHRLRLIALLSMTESTATRSELEHLPLVLGLSPPVDLGEIVLPD